MSRQKLELEPRLRFPASGEHAFGPGKAELLGRIGETGSIARAAAQMKMSYNRAWILVREMNQMFQEPLVVMARGGSAGGGALLTKSGKDTVRRYRRMETACVRAVRRDWDVIRRRLRR